MKKFKSGFTLAEVLITLGVIGVVAAITMPSLITTYQYKTVGVKLSKFASLLENAARPFVISNDSFRRSITASSPDALAVEEFINDTFLITEVVGTRGTDAEALSNLGATYVNYASNVTVFPETLPQGTLNEATSTDVPPVLKLKDGTLLKFYGLNGNTALSNANTEGTTAASGDSDNVIPVNFLQVGEPAFAVVFDPNVTGLPTGVQRSFSFVVTELGYVFPHNADECLEGIYNDDYSTTSRTFKRTACQIVSGTT